MWASASAELHTKIAPKAFVRKKNQGPEILLFKLFTSYMTLTGFALCFCSAFNQRANLGRHRGKLSTICSLITPVLPCGNQQHGNKTKPPQKCTEGCIENSEIPAPNLARTSPPWLVLTQLREVSLSIIS